MFTASQWLGLAALLAAASPEPVSFRDGLRRAATACRAQSSRDALVDCTCRTLRTLRLAAHTTVRTPTDGPSGSTIVEGELVLVPLGEHFSVSTDGDGRVRACGMTEDRGERRDPRVAR